METLQRTANRGSISTGYDIDNSLKFEADNTEYLTRTPSSAGNEKTWTWSGWIKYTEPTLSPQTVFAGGTDSGTYGAINFRLDAGKMELNTATTGLRHSTQRFRDPSAWYHFVVAMDTTQSTADDRIKIYVNGSQITDFSVSNNPPQNTDTGVNANELQTISRRSHANDRYFSGYMAEVHLVDGTALTPTSFGEYDDDSGIWKPKAYDGSYGTNGYYLDFEDSSSLGTDQSGNGNNFTLNNITAADQATDTPTNNFATLNPLWNVYNEVQRFTLTEGGTTITGNQSSTLWRGVPGTIPVNTGKWYWEVERGNGVNGIMVGAGSIEGGSAGWVDWRELTSIPSGGKAKMMYSLNMGIYGYSASQDAWQYGGSNFNTAGDIISVALDLDNGYMYFRKNGAAWLQSGDPSSGSSGTGAIKINWDADGDFTVPVVTVPNNTVDTRVNFGGYTETSISSGNSDANGYGNFEYAVPSGYYAICTKNLAEFG